MALDIEMVNFSSWTGIMIQWTDSPETDGDLFYLERCLIYKALNFVPAVCCAYDYIYIYMIIITVITKQ